MLGRSYLAGTESSLFSFQVDEEPAIRTNTTILLGNIANHLNDAVRCPCLSTLFLDLVVLPHVCKIVEDCNLEEILSEVSWMQTRKRVLINAFTVRALRDVFPPARVAGNF